MKKKWSTFLLCIIVLLEICACKNIQEAKIPQEEESNLASQVLIRKANKEDLDFQVASNNEQKELWTFTHEKTTQTESLTDYRYIGIDPNNYLLLGEDLYRIIGVFPVSDGKSDPELRLKIIKKDPLIGSFDDKNKNVFSLSSLKKNLNETFYKSLNEKDQEKIADALWYLGGNEENADEKIDSTETFYRKERGQVTYQNQESSWVGKVGLLYPSDYGFSTSGGRNVTRKACLDQGLYGFGWMENLECPNNSWLYDSTTRETLILQWTMMPSDTDPNQIFVIDTDGKIVKKDANTKTISYRPVMYLKKEVIIQKGSGTIEDPYILSDTLEEEGEKTI